MSPPVTGGGGIASGASTCKPESVSPHSTSADWQPVTLTTHTRLLRMKEGPTEGPEDISTERLPPFPRVLRNGVASLFLPFLPKLGVPDAHSGSVWKWRGFGRVVLEDLALI